MMPVAPAPGPGRETVVNVEGAGVEVSMINAAAVAAAVAAVAATGKVLPSALFWCKGSDVHYAITKNYKEARTVAVSYDTSSQKIYDNKSHQFNRGVIDLLLAWNGRIPAHVFAAFLKRLDDYPVHHVVGAANSPGKRNKAWNYTRMSVITIDEKSYYIATTQFLFEMKFFFKGAIDIIPFMEENDRDKLPEFINNYKSKTREYIKKSKTMSPGVDIEEDFPGLMNELQQYQAQAAPLVSAALPATTPSDVGSHGGALVTTDMDVEEEPATNALDVEAPDSDDEEPTQPATTVLPSSAMNHDDSIDESGQLGQNSPPYAPAHPQPASPGMDDDSDDDSDDQIIQFLSPAALKARLTRVEAELLTHVELLEETKDEAAFFKQETDASKDEAAASKDEAAALKEELDRTAASKQEVLELLDRAQTEAAASKAALKDKAEEAAASRAVAAVFKQKADTSNAEAAVFKKKAYRP